MNRKNVIFIILSILIIIIGVIMGIFVYKNYIYEEVINLDLDISIYSDKTLFDFQDSIECELKDNQDIATEKLGNVEIVTHCRNLDNKKIQYIINFNVVDNVKPKIILKDSYTVTEGYQKNLTDVIISADNYDDKPKREIIGEYDFNKVGSYDLVYKITDNSGNVATQNFKLNVVPKTKSTPSNSYIDFKDVLADYKNENTEIGIDVSKWQGKIDFKKVSEAGAEFVMIRIGYQDGFGGEYMLDPYFKSNIESAISNNLKVGIYFYSYSDSIEESKKQAEWIVNNLKGYKIDLPVVYDWESWSSFNSLNVSLHKFNKIATAFLEEIDKNNYIPMLYSSKNYLENVWDEQIYKVWVAHYTTKTNYQGNYYLWQMCSDGKIDGINGYVDIDILYK